VRARNQRDFQRAVRGMRAAMSLVHGGKTMSTMKQMEAAAGFSFIGAVVAVYAVFGSVSSFVFWASHVVA
jgi:hypothetical protein